MGAGGFAGRGARLTVTCFLAATGVPGAGNVFPAEGSVVVMAGVGSGSECRAGIAGVNSFAGWLSVAGAATRLSAGLSSMAGMVIPSCSTSGAVRMSGARFLAAAGVMSSATGSPSGGAPSTDTRRKPSSVATPERRMPPVFRRVLRSTTTRPLRSARVSLLYSVYLRKVFAFFCLGRASPVRSKPAPRGASQVVLLVEAAIFLLLRSRRVRCPW